MHPQRLLMAVVAGSVVAGFSGLGAQSGGNVELGGFGQFTRSDAAWRVKNGYGGGGRLGVFLSRNWELEGDVGISTFANEPPRAAGNSTNYVFTGQLTFNVPVGPHQLLLEAGAGDERFAGHDDFTVPLGGGIRFMLGEYAALRFDGIVQYVENPTASTFGFPPPPQGGVNSKAARSTNLEIRAGLSFLLGKEKEAPPPPVVAATPPPRQQTPPPATRETPPPAGPDRSAIIRDSLAAVDRARASLTAKVYFDFDRAEMRGDQAAVLDSKIPIMRANPGVRIQIQGNADERGSDEYNVALGMRRAQTARKYLIDHGIDAARLDISSNGEERGVCQEHAESCWSQNRRDEFVIIAGGDRLVSPR